MDHSYRRCYHYRNIGVFIDGYLILTGFFSSEHVSNAICLSITVTSKQEPYGQTTVQDMLQRLMPYCGIYSIERGLLGRRTQTRKNYLFYENCKWISY